jgi:hypothetical protein
MGGQSFGCAATGLGTTNSKPWSALVDDARNVLFYREPKMAIDHARLIRAVLARLEDRDQFPVNAKLRLSGPGRVGNVFG